MFFEHARSQPSAPRRLAAGSKFHGLLKARIPWSQGKMQGILRNQPFFANIRLENISEFRCLRMNSLRRQSREFFCQRRELIRRAGNEQGIRRKTDPRGPTHPMASEYLSVLDTKVINNMVACADEHASRLGCASRAPDQIRETRITKPKPQRLFLGVADTFARKSGRRDPSRWVDPPAAAANPARRSSRASCSRPIAASAKYRSARSSRESPGRSPWRPAPTCPYC